MSAKKMVEISGLVKTVPGGTLNLNNVLADISIEEIIDITELGSMENLSLAANNISHLPAIFAERLSNLTHLNLSSNNLDKLPTSLKNLKKLEHLNLSNNHFLSLPETIGYLTMLKTLNASRNNIKEVPDNLVNLLKLESLDLSNNELTNLPLNYKNLDQLINLTLAWNQFKEIPKCIIYGMRLLQTLDLSGNLTCHLQLEPFSTKLKIFYAKDNLQCLIFPHWILSFKYSQLHDVSFDNTYFAIYDLPRWFESHIRSLSMEQSTLSDSVLIKLLSGMAFLEKLYIGNKSADKHGNALWSMLDYCPPNPSRLKEINMQGTGISIIPRNVNNYKNLLYIDLSRNDITWLPDEITELEKLKTLRVEVNKLALLPTNIGHLKCLTELKACDNHLDQLPDSFKDLHNLQFLDLYNNEFTSLPEGLEQLKSLLGLDLEQNYFPTDSLLINNTLYELMRSTLREHWSDGTRFFDGIKIRSQINTIEDSDSNSRGSRNNDFPEDSQLNIFEGNDFETEQNWDDDVYDTDDEFDPNEMKPRIKLTPSPLSTSQGHSLWPLKLHQPYFRDQLHCALKKGTVIFPEFVDGQYDDADEEYLHN